MLSVSSLTRVLFGDYWTVSVRLVVFEVFPEVPVNVSV
jgi:hypothetical protein